jgi:outer membrane protein assembly complex protein YaeT
MIRLAAWSLGGLLGFLGLLALAVHTPAARRLALREVAGILRTAGIGFSASELDYNLFGLHVELRNPRVQSLAAPDLPAVFAADRVRADLSLRQLIRGAYHIRNAAIDNPRVEVVIDANGRDNLPHPPARNQPSGSVDFQLGHLAVNGGAVSFAELRQQASVHLPLDQITVDGGQIRLRTRDGGKAAFGTRSLPVRSIAGDLQLGKDALQVRSLRVDLGDSNLAITGNVTRFDNPQLDLRGEAALRLAAFVPNVRGMIHLTATAAGPLDGLTVTARIHGESLAADRFDRVNVDADAVYSAATSRVRVDGLRVGSPLGSMRASADVALKSGESSARFDLADADLERLSALLGLPVHVASRATASGEARWPGLQFEQAAGEAGIRLRAGRLAQNLIPVEASLHASGRADRMVVAIENLRSFGATASGEVVLTGQKTLAGDLRIEAAHLSATAAAAEAFLGKPLGTPIDGRLAATAKLAGTVTEPAATLTAAIPDLAAGELRNVSVNLAGAYTPARVSIDEAAVKWQNQELRVTGTVGNELHLSARADQIGIAAVLAGLNHADVPVAGNLSLSAEVTGTATNPAAAVTLAGSDLVAYQESLGSLLARAQLRGRQVEVTELRLEKPQPQESGSLRASGTYDLDSGKYTLQSQSQNLRLLSLTLPDGTPVRGALDLTASGQGTADEIAGELKLVADAIRIGDQDYGSAELTARTANRQVDFQASAPKFNVSASGKIGTESPNTAALQVRLADSTFPGLDGTISAVIDASVNLQDYRRGTARAEVSKLEIKLNGEPVRTDGPLVARYADGAVTVERAVIVAADSRVEAGGSLPVEPAAQEGELHLTGQLNLAGLAHFAPPGRKLQLEGTASLEGVIRGTLRRMDPTLSIVLENGSASFAGLTPSITGASVRGRIRGGALELESASAKWGDASFDARGTVPFALLPADLPVELPRAQGPATLHAELKNVDLAAIEGMKEGLSGMVSVRLDAEAPRPELEAVKATLTFPTLEARLDTYSIAQNGTSEIALENGVANIRHFELTGPATKFQLSGTAGLTGEQPLDVKLDGTLDASLASLFVDGLRARGTTEVHAAVSGPAKQLKAKGYVQAADAQISLEDPRIGIDGLNLRVNLDGTRATIASLEGDINGGTLSGRGSIAYADGKIQDSDLTLTAEDLYLDFPAGLKTISDLTLKLKNVGQNLALRGTVLVKEGGFTDDLNFDKGILADATAPRPLETTEARNPLLESLRLNISVVTQDPIVVENNLAKAQLTAQLVVLGNPYEMGLAGRLILEEGSELTLQERKYAISRGIITFANERRIEPSLDIEATTTVSGYDITLRVSGPPDETKTELSSNPVLPEPDILAILVTGKTLGEVQGQEMQVAETQLLSYLTGRVGSTIGRQLERATGLSQVRIEPNLIAAETNPSARLTVGQNVTSQLQVVYSMDLVNSADQIYIVEYDFTKRFVTRGMRQSDGSALFDFRHDVRFGGIAPERRSAKRDERRIGSLVFTGNSYFNQDLLQNKLKVKPGDRYDFFKVRRGLDRVTRLYTKEGLLESSVRLRREQKGSTVYLNFNIEPGPKVEFVFEGAEVPGGVQKDVRRVWSSGVFDSQRAEDAAGVLRDWLIGEDYLKPEIKPEISEPAADRKHVVFDIQRGPKFQNVEWVFEGARDVSSKRLREVIESQKLTKEVYTRPARVMELLTQFYRETGHLDAAVQSPRYELNSGNHRGRVIFPVKEGPEYLVGEPRFEGNRAVSTAELAETVPLPRGEPYRPVLRENAIQRLREIYWSRGYNEASIEAAVARVPERALANLEFRIVENAKSVVREIVIEGNQSTSDNLIRTQIELQPGEPVDLQKINSARRKLYNTGAFAMVDITREDMERSADNPQPDSNPVRLHVKVREVRPFSIRYGGFYDTERGPGGIVDITNRNSLGSARVLGLRARYDSQLHEARLYFSQPLLKRFPLKTIVNPYIRREINPETEEASGFNVDRLGVSLEQEAALGNKIILNYGYRIEKSRTYDTGPDAFFNVPLRIAALSTTVSRDTRDELLDASRGSFLSHAFEFSPESLGSQVRFVKYFGQYFRYFPLQKPRVELFTNRVLRPRLVYATAARVGLAGGLGDQEVPISERFFAGGGTTIRGFAQNSVGPATFSGIQLGGNGMLVLNNELRFPLVSILDGVGFVDIGNVYAKVSDFSLADVRKSAGFGLRLRTPWVLLRLDYGFKLDRRPGETTGRLFFSIGQAF